MVIAVTVSLLALPACAQTTFSFGDNAKLDILTSRYFDRDLCDESPLRDFHLPIAIPVGGSDAEFIDLDFHVKESRFYFATNTRVGSEAVKLFVEFDSRRISICRERLTELSSDDNP